MQLIHSPPRWPLTAKQASLGVDCIRRANALSDPLDALMESISRRPASDLGDAVIQLGMAARIMRVVIGSDGAGPITETVERLVDSALVAVEAGS